MFRWTRPMRARRRIAAVAVALLAMTAAGGTATAYECQPDDGPLPCCEDTQKVFDRLGIDTACPQ